MMKRKRRSQQKQSQTNFSSSNNQKNMKQSSIVPRNLQTQKEQILEDQVLQDDENNNLPLKILRNSVKKVTNASKNVNFQLDTQKTSGSLFQEQNYRKFTIEKKSQNSFEKQYQTLEDKSTIPHSQVSDSRYVFKQQFENGLKNIHKAQIKYSQSEFEQSLTKQLTFETLFNQFQDQPDVYPKIDILRCSFIPYKRKKIEHQYQLLQKVGQGAFGNVYRCRHKASKSIRSVKIIKPSMLNFKMNLNTIKQEIQILRKLDHPSIIKLYQIFEYHKVIYLVCEYCDGGTLKSYISKKFKFTNQMKKTIIKRIFEGVSYIHNMGILHRDLKPQNILFVNKITQSSTVQQIDIRIIDFGLSIQIKEKQIKDWAKIGSVPYMSPQVFKGIYSTKSDSWSCGVIVHILYLGYNPFLDAQDFIILNKIENYKLLQNPKWQQLQKPIRQILISLLNVNYILRGQIETTLTHIFFKTKCNYNQRDRKTSSELQNQRRFNNFINFLKYYLVFNKITQENSEQYGKCFTKLDSNNNGVISYQQLQNMLSFQRMSQHSIRCIFDNINLDNSGKIKYGQFLCALENVHSLFTIENINEIFDKIDISKDGFLDLYQFKHFMIDFSKKDENCVESLIKAILEYGRKRINRSQFLWYIINDIFL